MLDHLTALAIQTRDEYGHTIAFYERNERAILRSIEAFERMSGTAERLDRNLAQASATLASTGASDMSLYYPVA